MRVFEFKQSAVDGGHPVPNSGPFRHGEYLIAVSKRDLATLAKLVLEKSPRAKKHLKQLLALGDNFVCPLGSIEDDESIR